MTNDKTTSPLLPQQGGEQAQSSISLELRSYAADPGFSHQDYADVMLIAANEIDRLRAAVSPQVGEAIDAEKVRYGMMKTTYVAELEMLRTFNYEQCLEAWKDMYHKTRPLVEYRQFENIWRMCLERTAAPASLGEAKAVAPEAALMKCKMCGKIPAPPSNSGECSNCKWDELDVLTYSELESLYHAQCALTDEIVKKLDVGSDAELLARIDELETSLATMNKRYSEATAAPVAQAMPVAAEKDAEISRLNAIINMPQSGDFLRAVSIEAEHQRQRYSSEHDAGKTAADWFWLVGYLAGKALHSHSTGNMVKAEHHVITTAAALLNWHMAMFGKTDMRPGIESPSDDMHLLVASMMSEGA